MIHLGETLPEGAVKLAYHISAGKLSTFWSTPLRCLQWKGTCTMVHTVQSCNQGPVMCTGSLILWVVVVFFLMLCTFGIGAASGELS